MSAAFGIGPNDILDAPPEIQDELEQIRERIAKQRSASRSAPGAPSSLPSLTDDEIIRSIEQAEFGLPA